MCKAHLVTGPGTRAAFHGDLYATQVWSVWKGGPQLSLSAKLASSLLPGASACLLVGRSVLRHNAVKSPSHPQGPLLNQQNTGPIRCTVEGRPVRLTGAAVACTSAHRFGGHPGSLAICTLSRPYLPFLTYCCHSIKFLMIDKYCLIHHRNLSRGMQAANNTTKPFGKILL